MLDRLTAEKIVAEQVGAVSKNPLLVQGNGCAACHVLLALKDRMDISEVDAAALLSEVLLGSPELDNRFIQMVEEIHMKQRATGTTFAIKSRDAKNRHLDSQLKNSLEELLSDAASFGVGTAVRKLVLTHAALQIAQNMGIDYHAATEELYHYMRHNHESERDLEKLILSLLGRVKK